VLALAVHTTEGFFVGLGLLVGYLTAVAALIVAIAKPILPDHVGIITVNGRFRGAGLEFGLPPGAVVSHGWWLMLGCAVLGTLLLMVTHYAARAYLRRVRARRSVHAAR
jgi:hypothetical protein